MVDINSVPTSANLAVDASETSQADLRMALKAVEDMCIGGILLLVFAPLMLLIALAIRLDSEGPIFFKQKRFGLRNQEIMVFKFRTMRTAELDYDCHRQTERGDARITRVGRFLRKSSLDELPQLLNVLRGEMSLVGPRPHAVNMRVGNKYCHEIVPNYLDRHRVKPGITGWAQVNGYRGAIDSPQHLMTRVDHDFQYIEKCSVFFDMYILARTVFAMTSTKNAF